MGPSGDCSRTETVAGSTVPPVAHAKPTRTLENVETWVFEPSAENILLYIKNELEAQAPEGIQLEALRLYETSTSYVEWSR